MRYKLIFSLLAILAVIVGCADSSKQVPDSEFNSQRSSDIVLGRYLIKIMGCNDCHTPGYMSNSNIPEEDWLVGDSLFAVSPCEAEIG